MIEINCSNCGAKDFDIIKGLYTCKYCGSSFRFNSEEKFVECHGCDELVIVTVRFWRSFRTYDYIYDLEENVAVGDYLMVYGYNRRLTKVRVVAVKRMSIEELPMPINSYKYIISKYHVESTNESSSTYSGSGLCGTPFINKTTIYDKVEENKQAAKKCENVNVHSNFCDDFLGKYGGILKAIIIVVCASLWALARHPHMMR